MRNESDLQGNWKDEVCLLHQFAAEEVNIVHCFEFSGALK